jgi:hypothetical protein
MTTTSSNKTIGITTYPIPIVRMVHLPRSELESRFSASPGTALDPPPDTAQSVRGGQCRGGWNSGDTIRANGSLTSHNDCLL